MASADELLATALRHHQAGQLPQAEELYRQVLALDPRNADAWHLLGVAAHHSGRNDEAVERIGQAIAIDAGQAIFHGNLALAYSALGRGDEAFASYCEAIRLQPGYAVAHNNLGAFWHARGRFAEAEACFRQAAQLRPDYAEAHNNLGAALKELGRLNDAVAHYHEALRLRPGWPEALSNLGAALSAQGRDQEAVECYLEALAAQPDYAEAQNNMGASLRALGRLEEAIAFCREAVRLRPGYVAAIKNLATFLQEHGDAPGARACLAEARGPAAADGLKIKSELALPVIYGSAEEMEQERARVEAAFAELAAQTLTIADPFQEVGTAAFELAYQGLDDRALLATLAAIYLRATPSLAYEAPHCRQPARGAGRRLRIGFLSRFFYNHTIGRLNLGVFRNLSRDRFHVSLVHPPSRKDDMARAFEACADAVLALPENLERARQMIADAQLDVLVHTDIGMDPFTYFLAFARLAPVQCACWGHPETSGIPAIDYFLSSELLEGSGSETQYTEQLVRLRSLGIYYERPQAPALMKSREAFGLPSDAHLYGCPQSLFKLHPEFDALLGAILRQDPRGLLVLLSGKHAAWHERLRRRFARTMPDVADRVHFLPRLTHVDFLSLNAACDVLLDPTHFGGGNTAYEALALGTPIVTWPSQYLRGRITLGLYKRMGLLDCVAQSGEDYVAKALRLATEPDHRGQIRQQILDTNHVLYEDTGAVRALEEFLAGAVARVEA